MDGETMPVPLWLPDFDVEAAGDAIDTAIARLDAAEAAQADAWVSAAAEAFRDELAGLRVRAAAVRGRVDEARDAWRALAAEARRAGQW